MVVCWFSLGWWVLVNLFTAKEFTRLNIFTDNTTEWSFECVWICTNVSHIKQHYALDLSSDKWESVWPRNPFTRTHNHCSKWNREEVSYTELHLWLVVAFTIQQKGSRDTSEWGTDWTRQHRLFSFRTFSFSFPVILAERLDLHTKACIIKEP